MPRPDPSAAPSAGTSRVRRPPRVPAWVLGVVAVAAAGALVRLTMLLRGVVEFEADEAVTGIMAQRILDGETYAFFAGQTYMGALEQYLQAGVLAVLPDTPTTLRLLQVLLTSATCVLVGVLGRRVTGGPWGGVLAAALYAAGPFYNAAKGVRSHGAYDTAQLLGVLAMLTVLAIAAGRRTLPRAAFAVGLVCGLLLWESWLGVFALVPVVLWGLGGARGALMRAVPAAAAGALVGASPLVVHRILHGPFPPSGTGTPPPTTFSERTAHLLDPVLGMFLGVRRPGAGSAVSQWITPALVVMAVLALMGVAVWTRRGGLADLMRLRTGHREPVDMCLLALVLVPIPYGLSTYTWFTGEPRYLFTVYPFAVLVAAWGICRLPDRTAAAVGTAAVLVVGAMTLHTSDVVRNDFGGGGIADGVHVRADDLPAVVRALRARGVRSARADYWLAYPLQFAAGDQLAVAPYANSRFPELDAAVAADPEPAYVTPTPAADALQQRITASGSRARRVTVGPITAFIQLDPPRMPQQLGLP